MIAGTLEVQMLANLARLSKDMHDAKTLVGGAMKSIESSVALAKSALGALGIGLGIGALVGMAKSAIDSAEKLHDLSLATRISIEDLSGLKLMAKQSGSDLESVAQAINKLGQNIGKDPEKFRALGITAKTNLEAFKQVSDIFVNLEDDQLRNAVMSKLLGKQWQGTAAALSEGSVKIQEMIDKGKKLSGMTKEQGAAADNLKDRMAEMTTSFDAGTKKLVFMMMPAFTDIITAMAKTAEESSKLQVALVGLGGVLSWLFGLTDSQKVASRLKDIEEQMATTRKQIASGTLNPPGASDSFFNFLIPDVKLNDAAKARLRKTMEELEAEKARLTPAIPKPPPTPGMSQKEKDELAKRAAAFAQEKKAGADAARMSYLESRAKAELEILKDGLGHQQQMLDAKHQENLIGDKEYFSQRIALAKQASDAEDAALTKLLGAQQKALGATIKGTGEYWKALKDVKETEDGRAKVAREFGQATEAAYAQARKAAEDYKRSIEGVNVQILQLTGETAKAAAVQFEIQNRDLRKKAVINDDPVGVAAIDRLAALTAKQAEFNQEKDKLNDINARLQIEEQRIQNTLRTGAVGELESLMQTGNARAASIKQQEEIIANLKKIAAESANPALVLQAEQAQAAFEKLKSETDLVGQKIESVFSSSAANAFSSFASGSMTAKDAFMSFVGSVLDGFARMAAEAGAQKIFKALGVGDLIGSLVTPLATAIGQMITTWATGEATITALSTTADAERMALSTAATIEGIASAKIAAMSEITAYAGIAAAAAMASVAAIPYYGWAMAPGVGAETFATAMSYLALAALETGTNYVPQTGMYMLHEGEAVQPKRYNPAIGEAKNESSSGGATHLHFHGPVFDHQSFGKYLVKTLKGQSRMLNPAMSTDSTKGG